MVLDLASMDPRHNPCRLEYSLRGLGPSVGDPILCIGILRSAFGDLGQGAEAMGTAVGVSSSALMDLGGPKAT